MNVNETNEKPRLDLEAIRAKLAGQTGKRYWRSLEEVAEQPEFQLWMEDEFPNRSTILQINRRDLLKFMGASMALAGMSGCRSVFLPEDKVVPYVKQPEELVPGKALFYASSVLLAGYATGVLVEQHEGRPTMLAGNPDHPGSLGALDSLSQAEILNLYDPDRSDNVVYKGDISTIETFDLAVQAELQKAAKTGGAGLRILTGAVTSPSLTSTIDSFLKKFPNAKWHAYEPTGRANIYAGATLAYGKPLEPVYDFKNAAVVVSLDADFLNPTETPGSLRYARDFSSGRRVTGKTGVMNRLYAYESTPGLVGTVADHRYVLKAGDVYAVAQALASALGIAVDGAKVAGQAGSELAAVVTDIQANTGKVLVIAGKHQPAEVHALVFAINEKLGAVGKTVTMVEPIDVTADPTKVGDLKSLVDDLKAGKVDQLFVIDSNPAYSAPADFAIETVLPKAKFKVRVGQYEDETSKLCDWHIPQTHLLEEWGDARAFDGTVSLIQPLVAPLYSGISSTEFFARLQGNALGGYDLLRAYWKKTGLGGDYEKSWRQVIHDGVVKGSEAKAVTATVKLPALPAAKQSSGIEVNFRPDPTIYDGRLANNGWLQELPKPLTKITWDNVVYLSAKTATKSGLATDDRVRVDLKGRQVEGAVFVHPGHPDDSVTLHLGYGRSEGGNVATVKGQDGGGFNAYLLRTSDAMSIGSGATLTFVSSNSEDTASTQGHSPLQSDRIEDDRDIIHDWTLAEFTTKIDDILKKEEDASKEIKENNLYPEQVFQFDGAQWGMTIDLNTCIGCNACVTACQAENNIPVVGKMQVARHREMHWLRIDRYYSGTDENPAVTWQPVACVQCEKAPCEPVCPVAATVHSHEGLNQMVYNRCVGTRYCSNNCPYKVRRFNYFNYTDNQPNFAEQVESSLSGNRLIPGPIHIQHKQGIPLLKMLNNPDVTVRGRGIMEKCTYCVQRINEARQESKKTNSTIKDGDIVTACQQACPTQTIVFGNIADRESQVSKLREDPRAYLLLEELQTRPRTSHLAKLRNPNPEIKSFPAFSKGGES
jgi:molybdopterin-containing oxidoreductase family iron-sulfur binding subunit